ncbi:DCN1-like protein 5 [Coemansia sp. Benny D115]|nr:DCN1-like protein 5 [Coemansia sp. Benny D115]
MSKQQFIEEYFAQFQDFERTDGSSTIMPDGFEKLCTELGYDMSDIEPLVLMWKLGGSELGVVSFDEWQSGVSSLGASSAAELRKAVDGVVAQLAVDVSLYRAFYRRMFNYLKAEKQKTISAEAARDILPVIKAKDNEVFDKFVAFLEASSDKVKAINRDQWQSLLELSRTMDGSLAGYSKDDAWPALFDDFAEWVQSQS